MVSRAGFPWSSRTGQSKTERNQLRKVGSKVATCTAVASALARFRDLRTNAGLSIARLSPEVEDLGPDRTIPRRDERICSCVHSIAMRSMFVSWMEKLGRIGEPGGAIGSRQEQRSPSAWVEFIGSMGRRCRGEGVQGNGPIGLGMDLCGHLTKVRSKHYAFFSFGFCSSSDSCSHTSDRSCPPRFVWSTPQLSMGCRFWLSVGPGKGQAFPRAGCGCGTRQGRSVSRCWVVVKCPPAWEGSQFPWRPEGRGLSRAGFLPSLGRPRPALSRGGCCHGAILFSAVLGSDAAVDPASVAEAPTGPSGDGPDP